MWPITGGTSLEMRIAIKAMLMRDMAAMKTKTKAATVITKVATITDATQRSLSKKKAVMAEGTVATMIGTTLVMVVIVDADLAIRELLIPATIMGVLTVVTFPRTDSVLDIPIAGTTTVRVVTEIPLGILKMAMEMADSLGDGCTSR
jgi:hypothetical protein